MERRAVGVYRLKIAVSASDTVDLLLTSDALVTAALTGDISPKILESPLDVCIERLRVDHIYLDQLPKDSTECGLSGIYITISVPAKCNYTMFP